MSFVSSCGGVLSQATVAQNRAKFSGRLGESANWEIREWSILSGVARTRTRYNFGTFKEREIR